jgi:hypothetical protein
VDRVSNSPDPSIRITLDVPSNAENATEGFAQDVVRQ